MIMEIRTLLSKLLSGDTVGPECFNNTKEYSFAAAQLKDAGFAVEKKADGIFLQPADDVIDTNEINDRLKGKASKFKVEFIRETTSTLDIIRERAKAGAPEGTVIIAERQTAGRGRNGKSFLSPPGTGIYMCVLLRPSFGPTESTLITPAAAVAVAEAAEQLSGKKAGIKWVNDVFMDDRKICGILTEASLSAGYGESNVKTEYAALGMGINAYAPPGGFPEGLNRVAGSVFGEQPYKNLRNLMIASVLNNFSEVYASLESRKFIEGYRRRLFMLNTSVTVKNGASSRPATAIDVDRNCRLIVRYENGETERLSGGEISVRPRE